MSSGHHGHDLPAAVSHPTRSFSMAVSYWGGLPQKGGVKAESCPALESGQACTCFGRWSDFVLGYGRQCSPHSENACAGALGTTGTHGLTGAAKPHGRPQADTPVNTPAEVGPRASPARASHVREGTSKGPALESPQWAKSSQLRPQQSRGRNKPTMPTSRTQQHNRVAVSTTGWRGVLPSHGDRTPAGYG